MKTKFIPICLVFFSLVAVSCGGNSGSGDVASRLLSERDSLKALATQNQLELERMTVFFDEVSACIDSITVQEDHIIDEVDIEKNRRYNSSEIAQRLTRLTEIIAEQRQRIASLVDSLNNQADTSRLNGLRHTIAYLTTQLSLKEKQIQQLRTEISSNQRNIRSLNSRIQDLNAEVGSLALRNTALTEAVQVQTEIINEGYVLVGTKQNLKEMGVIEGGGFLRRSSVNLGNVNTSKCSKVNIALFNELPLNSGKFKILSPTPASSYTVRREGNRATLVITDANTFWSLSNILVIQIQ